MFLVVLEKGGRFCWNDFVCQERLALSPVAKRGRGKPARHMSPFFFKEFTGDQKGTGSLL